MLLYYATGFCPQSTCTLIETNGKRSEREGGGREGERDRGREGEREIEGGGRSYIVEHRASVPGRGG